MRFVFRHFPLTNSHPHAQHAAEAAEVAAQGGVFWPMYDALYAERSEAVRSDGCWSVRRRPACRASDLQRAWAAHDVLAA